MATKNQLDTFEKKLKIFIREKITEKNLTLKEADTRIIINCFLSSVLNYKQFDDIKTEYRIKSDYADYVIQLNKKLRMVVEVKAMELDLTIRHLKQAFNYAVNEGIDWLMLTNARQIMVCKVIFGKPPEIKLLYNVDLMDNKKRIKKIY